VHDAFPVWPRHGLAPPPSSVRVFFVFFFTLVTGPRRSLRLELSDTRVSARQIQARLGTTWSVYTSTTAPVCMQRGCLAPEAASGSGALVLCIEPTSSLPVLQIPILNYEISYERVPRTGSPPPPHLRWDAFCAISLQVL